MSLGGFGPDTGRFRDLDDAVLRDITRRNELRQRLLNIYSLSEHWTPKLIEQAIYALNARIESERCAIIGGDK